MPAPPSRNCHTSPTPSPGRCAIFSTPAFIATIAAPPPSSARKETVTSYRCPECTSRHTLETIDIRTGDRDQMCATCGHHW
ncbi:hypothetical protein [Streptomyces rhizosphaericus]|uniref:hypothetical protein n=1 Tax=Streptomyces rhizosphaericus TaxID=114699 RepID=UPI0036433814